MQNMLQSVARQVNDQIRATDTLVRLDGERFLILFPETDMQQAFSVIEKIHAHINRALQVNGWPVDAVMGAVTFQKPPDSVDQMISVADDLMRQARTDETSGIRTLVVTRDAPLFPCVTV